MTTKAVIVLTETQSEQIEAMQIDGQAILASIRREPFNAERQNAAASGRWLCVCRTISAKQLEKIRAILKKSET